MKFFLKMYFLYVKKTSKECPSFFDYKERNLFRVHFVRKEEPVTRIKYYKYSADCYPTMPRQLFCGILITPLLIDIECLPVVSNW